jgi:pathogenesis-related protein 1
MKTIKIGIFYALLLFIHACSHPIEIEGEGDVSSNFGRSCTLEDSLTKPVPDNCAKNLVTHDYFDTYTATPRTGWKFDHWGNYCTDAVDNTCTFNITADQVRGAWLQTAPPLVAVFTLDGDVDCSTIVPGSSFSDEMLCSHNARRGTFPTPTPVPALDDMEWDQALADIAADYAEQCTWRHNANRSDNYSGYVGENMALFSSGWSVSSLVESTLTNWVEGEISNYDYASNSCSGTCGHYTQVVWRDTEHVGCAVQQCATVTNLSSSWDNAYLLVCNYSPGGNFNGQQPY